MERPIEICNHYTYKDFTNFAEFHCQKVQGVKYFRHLGILMIFATIWFFITSSEMTIINFILNPSFLLSALFIFMAYWVPGNTAKQMYRGCEKNDALNNTVIFDDEKVKFVSPNTEGVYFYKQLHRCYETEQYFYIYLTRSMAQIIRKEDFTDGTPEALRSFLAENPKVKFVKKYK